MGDFKAIRLPSGFKWGANGALVAVSEHAKGAEIEHILSNNPLFIDRIQEGEVKGEFSVTFKHWIKAKNWHDVTVNNKTLFATHGTAELFDKGVIVHDDQQFKRYCKGHIDMLLAEKEELDVRYDQFGWKKDDTAFLYGLNLYGPDGVKPATASPDIIYRVEKRIVGVAPGAKLAVWSANVNGLFAKGAEPQSISMLASFAAPLIRLLEIEEGGCVLHFNTPESGKGKTWALLGAISVWGRKWGISSHSDDTKVSKGVMRGVMGNLPVFNDELTMRDPEVLKSFITQFTDGRDRLRTGTDGQLRHQASSWQTFLISASNMSLRDTLGDHAMSWRIIELDCELPREIKMSQGEDFKVMLRENSGIAGDVYLRYVMIPENLEAIKKQLRDVRNSLLDSKKWGNPKYRYWIRAVAAMIVAGTIVVQLGILQINVYRVIQWLEERLPFETTVQRSWAVEALSEYLRQEAKSGTLYMPGPWEPGVDTPPRPIQLPTRELLIRREEKGGRYYVAVKPFKDWLIRQEKSFSDLIRTLSSENVLVDKNRLVTLGAHSDLSGPQVRCLVVDGLHPMMAEVKPQ